jgi:hypothetical protein
MYQRKPQCHEHVETINKDWYTIVLENMSPFINQSTIIPTTFVLGDNGHKILRADEKSYVSRYVEDNDRDVLTHEIVYSWQTPQDVLETLKQDTKTTNLMTAIKYLINNKPSAILWHTGEKDGNCQHHGYRIHVLTCETTNEPSIRQSYPYIKLNKAVTEAQAQLKSQKVKLKPNFSRYMVKSQRPSAVVTTTPSSL